MALNEYDESEQGFTRIPTTIVIEHILPLLDRTTWNAVSLASKEIYQSCQRLALVPPWPCVSLIRETVTGSYDVGYVAFHPNGRILAACVGTSIFFWNQRSGPQAPFETLNHNLCIAFSPNGSFLATGNQEKSVQLWLFREDFTIDSFFTLTGHFSQILSVAFTPDSQVLASGSNHRVVKLWDVSDGTCLHSFHGHVGAVNYLSFSPDGQSLAVTTSDCLMVRVWNVDDLSGITLELDTGDDPDRACVACVAFSLCGRYCATSLTGSFQIRVRTCKGDFAMVHSLIGHNVVSSLHFTTHGGQPFLVSFSDAVRTVRIWSMERGTCERRLVVPPTMLSVIAVYGDTLVSAHEGGKIHWSNLNLVRRLDDTHIEESFREGLRRMLRDNFLQLTTEYMSSRIASAL